MKLSGLSKLAPATALVLACGLFAGESMASGSGADQKAAPENGRSYALGQKTAYFKAFNEAYMCLLTKMDKSRTYGAWYPEELGDCREHTDAFVPVRIDLDNGPALLFGNQEEEKTISQQATKFNEVHLAVAGLMTSLAAYDKTSKIGKTVKSIECT